MDIFEGVFKFEASEIRKKFDRTSSADQGAIGERPGRKFLIIGEQVIEKSLEIYENKKYSNT